MAEDRKSWPQAGRDAKVSGLSDLEHRVWEQYKLSANDLGVMPADAPLLQGANKALASRPAKLIQKCIDGIISAGLLLTFMAEDSLFVWSRKWQDWQQIKWPRRSPWPIPTNLHQASPKTRELFQIYSEKHGVLLPDDLGSTSQDPESISPSRAGAPDGRAGNPHPSPGPRVDPSSSEESARETTALAPVEHVRAIRPARAKSPMGSHLGCYFTPEACARGACLPSWLGLEWAQQFADLQQGQRYVRAFVAGVLANLPDGPLGDEPKVFWRAQWKARHGSVVPKPGSRTGDTVDAGREFIADRLAKLGVD